MEAPIFSYSAYRSLIEDFARKIPRLLASHPRTADLALEIERLRLEDVLETQFTMAIVGQMRVGKSTLLNAIIGRDLAPVAVTETTATVNWFRYSEREDDEKNFRVHWHDGRVSNHSLDEAYKWIGCSENAKNTAHLEFFARSSFLRRASIVDTPGTRAAIAEHRQVTDEFLAEKLAEKLEQETLAHGGRADAVLYVVNIVAREPDLAKLEFFGGNTRLAGSSPQNSIAVTQKWEHLEGDPLSEARRMSARMREQLARVVAEVVPTSGQLFRLTETLRASVFDDIVRLAETETRELRKLLSSEDFFVDADNKATLTADKRRELATTFRRSWIQLSMATKLSHSRGFSCGEELRAALRQASGVDHLRDMLNERFFAKAELIKANTILRKAFDPIRQALLRLQEVEVHRRHNHDRGERILSLLKQEAPQFSAMSEMARFIEEAIGTYAGDGREATKLLTSLADLQSRIQDSFDAIEADVKALDLLARSDELKLEEFEIKELRALFGADGQEPWQRLGCDSAQLVVEYAVAMAEDRLTYWNGRMHRCRGDQKLLCELATTRYSQVVDALLKKRNSEQPGATCS